MHPSGDRTGFVEELDVLELVLCYYDLHNERKLCNTLWNKVFVKDSSPDMVYLTGSVTSDWYSLLRMRLYPSLRYHLEQSKMSFSNALSYSVASWT